MRRLFLVSAALIAFVLAASPFPQRDLARGSAADEQFPAVPGATGQVWTGASAPLGAGGGPLPDQVSAVFEWSNASQSFRFWFRGFPANFNTLSALDQGGFYFFQSAGGFQVTMPGSDSYSAAASAPFGTQPGATGRLWAGGFTEPETLPPGISAVFRWNNANQSFDFWFRGFPANFNTLAGMAAGEFYFLQSSGGVEIVPSPGPAAGSSAALIDQALAAGDLEPLPGTTPEETALVYKVLAGFGGPIPSAYVGTAEEEEVGWLREARQAFPTLSSAAQDAIRPYLLPPAEAGSWDQLLNPAPLRAPVVWHTVSGPRVKVWWRDDRPQDQANAQTVRDEMEDFIWNELTGLMGVAPPSDAACNDSGGDGKFDIYLVASLPSASGLQTPSDCTPYETPFPSFTVLAAGNTSLPNLLAVATHELMHGIQFAFPGGLADGYAWLEEATAEWAIDYIYPLNNREHQGIDKFHRNLLANGSLNSYVYTTGPQYGACQWFLFLVRYLGDPAIIRDIWETTATHDDSLAGMAAVLGGQGQLDQLWSKFASYLPNRPPANHFQTWDGISQHFSDTSYNLDVGEVEQLDTRTAPLGVLGYDIVAFSSGPNRVLKVTNPLAGSAPSTASVWVVVGLNSGDYESPEDITDVAEKRFCADSSLTGVLGIDLFIANSSTTDSLSTAPLTVELLDEPCCPPASPARAADQCFEGYAATTTAVQTPTFNNGSAIFTLTANAQFVLEAAPDPNPNDQLFSYRSVSGSVQWSIGNFSNECSQLPGQTSGAVPVAWFEDDSAYLALDVDLASHTFDAYGYGPPGNWPPPDLIEFRCPVVPGGPQADYQLTGTANWFDPFFTARTFAGDGSVIAGSWSATGSGGTTSYTWSFVKH